MVLTSNSYRDQLSDRKQRLLSNWPVTFLPLAERDPGSATAWRGSLEIRPVSASLASPCLSSPPGPSRLMLSAMGEGQRP